MTDRIGMPGKSPQATTMANREMGIDLADSWERDGVTFEHANDIADRLKEHAQEAIDRSGVEGLARSFAMAGMRAVDWDHLADLYAERLVPEPEPDEDDAEPEPARGPSPSM